MSAQLRHPGLDGRVGDGVMGLVGVPLQVEVELPAGLGVPDVFIPLGDDKVHGVQAQAVLAVEPFPLHRMEQALALDGLGDGRAGQLQQSRHDVPQLHQIAAGPAARAHILLRAGDKQRHLGAALVGLGLHKEQVVAQHLAVVGHEEEDRVVHQLLLHQGRDDPADLMVHMGNGGVVGHPQLADELGVRGSRLGVVAVAVAEHPLHIVPVAAVGGLEVLVVVEMKVVFRRVHGRVGPDEAGHQEEGLAAVPAAQEIQALRGHPVGGMVFLLVEPGPGDPAVAVGAVVGGVGVDAQLLLEPEVVVVGHPLILVVGGVGGAVGVEIAVMEADVVESPGYCAAGPRAFCPRTGCSSPPC